MCTVMRYTDAMFTRISSIAQSVNHNYVEFILQVGIYTWQEPIACMVGVEQLPERTIHSVLLLYPHGGPDAINIAKLVQRRGVQTKWQFLNEFCEVSVRKPAKSLS